MLPITWKCLHSWIYPEHSCQCPSPKNIYNPSCRGELHVHTCIWHRHVAMWSQVQSPTSYRYSLVKLWGRSGPDWNTAGDFKQESIVLEPAKAISPQFITWAVLCIPALGMSFLFAPTELDLGWQFQAPSLKWEVGEALILVSFLKTKCCLGKRLRVEERETWDWS